MRKWLVATLAALLCLLVIPALAQAETSGYCGANWDNMTWVLDDEGTLTISGTGKMADYASYNGTLVSLAPWGQDVRRVVIEPGVANVSCYAFYKCGNLSSVTLPEGLTGIDKFAFYQCGSLPSIDLPESVTGIGESAFFECGSLTSIGRLKRLTGIGREAFMGCRSLSSITLPDSVSTIGSEAFDMCESLRSIDVDSGNGSFMSIDGILYNKSGTELICCPGGKEGTVHVREGVTKIGNFAFSCCRRLTAITLPDSVTMIDYWAFNCCSSLASISLPDNMTNIMNYAFCGCTSLNSITLPNGLKEISDGTFSGCKSLTRITLPEGITRIGESGFYGCESLVSITLPDSMRSFGNWSFSGCSSLTSLTLPDNFADLGEDNFYRCDKLKKIVMPRKADAGYCAFPSDCVIYCYPSTEAENWAYTFGYEVVYLDEVDIDSIREVSLPEDFRLGLEEPRPLVVNIFPDTGHPAVTLTSSDLEVISVTDGVITAHKVGTATLTATLGSASDSVKITTFIRADSFDFDLPDVWVIAQKSVQLTLTDFQPEGAEAFITWSSGDTSIARVSDSGFVTTYKLGDATITAVSEHNVTRTCVVHACYPVTSIAFASDELSIKAGASAQLTANVKMRAQSCVNQLVTFESSDDAVASVDAKGVVTGLSEGTTTIRAVAASGVTAECTVIVSRGSAEGEGGTLRLPEGLTAIRTEAFMGIDAEVVILPGSCESVGSRAFANCKNLRELHCSRDARISADAFEGCGEVNVIRE